MPTVTADTFDSSATTETTDGREKTYGYVVEGLTGYTSTHALESAALATSGIPAKGALLVGTTMSVTERSAKAMDPTTVRVEVKFSTPKNKGGDPDDDTMPSYQLSTAAAQVQTNADKDGILISLKHGTKPPVGAFVNVRKPHTTVRVKRYEGEIDVLAIAESVAGKYNSATWNGKPAGWWLCTDVDADSPDAGGHWTLQFVFELAESDKLPGGATKVIPWNPVAVYEDPDTGKPPADLTVANADDFGSTTAGIKEVPSYDGVDYNSLSI